MAKSARVEGQSKICKVSLPVGAALFHAPKNQPPFRPTLNDNGQVTHLAALRSPQTFANSFSKAATGFRPFALTNRFVADHVLK